MNAHVGPDFDTGTLTRDSSMPARWAALWGADPGTISLADGSGDRFVTAGELHELSGDRARRMLGRGLAAGDRVLVSASPGLDMAIAAVAVLRAGLVLVPVNPAFTPREVAHIIADARPALTLVDEADRAGWISEIPAPGAGFAVTSLSLDSSTPPDTASELDRSKGDDPAMIAYTSGTTGAPKGAVITHANLLANALSIAAAWRWTPEDRLLLALPLFHGHGLCNGLFGTLTAGASAVIFPGFDPEGICSAVKDRLASLFFGVPTMYRRLLTAPTIGSMRQLRLCVSGSAALPVALFEEFAAASGQRLLERYGTTEVLMALSNPYEGERRPGSVGLPLPGVSVRVVDGEILVKSPMVFAGYLNLAEASRAALAGGWFHTGDLAEESEDGYVTVRGRSKELIISGGFNVYPREVEDVLSLHPGVAEVAVAGRTSEEWGEQVVAFVVPAMPGPPEALVDALREIAAEHLAPYKRPKRVVLLESLPRNALGKVVKHEL